MARIIVADDSEDICRLLKRALEKDGHSVTVMYDTRALDEKLCSQAELIILDVMMPGEDGVAACARIRSFTDCPILFLTAKGEDEDVLYGLGAGGDDYLTKPFHFQELEARIRSLTRRKFVQEDVCLKWNQLTFDTRTRETSVNGVPISLTRKESSLLEYFLLHQNRVISPEEMIEHIWDGSVNTFSNSIRVHISSLRKKLKAAIGFDPMQNKIGQGYILEEYR